MTAANGGIPSESVETFFSSVQTPFPDDIENGIDTVQFLNASKGIAALVDHFGYLFIPVRDDINGNIQKLMKKHAERPPDFKYLENIIMDELNSEKDVATDALLWLTRGLNLFRHFFANIIEDSRREERQHLPVLLRQSYSATLMQYHGWWTRKAFEIICNCGPNREQMFRIMALGKNHLELVVLRDIEQLLTNLTACLDKLERFYSENTRFRV